MPTHTHTHTRTYSYIIIHTNIPKNTHTRVYTEIKSGGKLLDNFFFFGLKHLFALEEIFLRSL